MFSFKIKSWSALAPGLSSQEDWQHWLTQPYSLSNIEQTLSLPAVKPLLRRRFDTLAKYAASAAFRLLETDEKIPCIFASRHGNIPLTHSLLVNMGQGEEMSPTAFSLAVHNAVSGLFSIARKDTSPSTAIAATKGLIPQTLFEVIGQLHDHEAVLCIVYDALLPELYRHYCHCEDHPYAIAILFSRDQGEQYTLSSHPLTGQEETTESEYIRLLSLLSKQCNEASFPLRNRQWQFQRIETDAR